jgi:hypothetical protein
LIDVLYLFDFFLFVFIPLLTDTQIAYVLKKDTFLKSVRLSWNCSLNSSDRQIIPIYYETEGSSYDVS